MAAIGGWIAPSRAPRFAKAACHRILRAQAFWGDHSRLLDAESGWLGAVSPNDPTPLAASLGRLSLVADARIDNRSELASALGENSRVTDVQLIARAFDRWGVAALDRLVGDFAIALYDRARRELLLARDGIGARPLFYGSVEGAIGFASMPSGLFASATLWNGFDFPSAARLLTDDLFAGAETYWQGISRVRPGEAVLWRNGEVRHFAHWRPKLGPDPRPSERDYVEEFRHLLDEAVRCRIRDVEGPIATHLSGGLDSGAVAATAARQLDERQRLIAFTAAPRLGFSNDVSRGYIADESALAAETARMAGIEQVIVRPTATVPVEHFRMSARFYQEPRRNIINARWGSQIYELARASGATVLLTGTLGNSGLSAGRASTFQEWMRRGRWSSWLTEARAAISSGSMSWRGVLINSFGPHVPAWLWNRLHRQYLDLVSVPIPTFIQSAWTRSLPTEQPPVPRPAKDIYADQLLSLQGDTGVFHHGALAEAGIDERDPTGDRRILEFSLRLPPEQLFKNGRSRALARTALSDRLPQAVVQSTMRGLQSADWFEYFTRDAARAMLEEIEFSSSATQFLNVPQLRKVIDAWPTGDWNRPYVQALYSSELPALLTAGLLIIETEEMVRNGLPVPDPSAVQTSEA